MSSLLKNDFPGTWCYLGILHCFVFCLPDRLPNRPNQHRPPQKTTSQTDCTPDGWLTNRTSDRTAQTRSRNKTEEATQTSQTLLYCLGILVNFCKTIPPRNQTGQTNTVPQKNKTALFLFAFAVCSLFRFFLCFASFFRLFLLGLCFVGGFAVCPLFRTISH